MRVGLVHGVSNSAGNDLIGVMQTSEGEYVELSICHGGYGGSEEKIKARVGDYVTIDYAEWRIVSVHNMVGISEYAPPGSGSGQLGAVIETDDLRLDRS